MSSSVSVNATTRRVWNLVAEANRWPDWSEVCTAVWDVPANPGDWRVGHRFGFRLRMATINVPFNVAVTRIEQDSPPGHSTDRLIEWTSTRFTITAVRAISVASSDAQGSDLDSAKCRVVDKKYFSSPLLPIGVAYPRWLIRRMTESWLHDLKQEAEAGE